jgi:hypothetical protein
MGITTDSSPNVPAESAGGLPHTLELREEYNGSLEPPSSTCILTYVLDSRTQIQTNFAGEFWTTNQLHSWLKLHMQRLHGFDCQDNLEKSS